MFLLPPSTLLQSRHEPNSTQLRLRLIVFPSQYFEFACLLIVDLHYPIFCPPWCHSWKAVEVQDLTSQAPICLKLHFQYVGEVHSWSYLKLCCMRFSNHFFPPRCQIRTVFSPLRRKRKCECGRVSSFPGVADIRESWCFRELGYPVERLDVH